MDFCFLEKSCTFDFMLSVATTICPLFTLFFLDRHNTTNDMGCNDATSLYFHFHRVFSTSPTNHDVSRGNATLMFCSVYYFYSLKRRDWGGGGGGWGVGMPPQ